MAKLAVAAVVLVALLALAQASFRSIVTTTVEEENQGQWGGQSQQRCWQQVQQWWQQLQPCKQYIQQSGSPFDMDIYMKPQQEEQQQLRQCCQRLRRFGEQCSCEAIKQIVQEQLQQEMGQGQGQGQWGQGGQQQQRVQQILQKARDLPRQCNIGRECQIQGPYY